MADKELSKDAVLFWLKRHLRHLEGLQAPDQEAMAKQGMSYSQRLTAVMEAEKGTNAGATEIEAFKQAIETIERS